MKIEQLIKNLILFIIMFNCGFVNIYAQEIDSLKLKLDNYFLSFIDTSMIKTGILLDKGFIFGYENLKQDSTYEDENGNMRKVPFYNSLKEWKRIYEGLRLASIKDIPEMKSTRNTKALSKKNYSEINPVIPFGILNFKANYLTDGDIKDLGNKIKPKIKSVNQLKIFAIAPMFDDVYSGNISFHLCPEHYYSNKKQKPKGIEINFSNDQDWKYFEWEDQKININYLSKGDKALKFRLFIGNDTLEADSKITIKTIDDVTPSETFSIQVPISDGSNQNARTEASISPPGNSNIQGQVGVYLGCDNLLDKPLIILEGFDAPNIVGLSDLFNNYDFLRDNDPEIDLVILNYGNGGDLIENNVLLFKELLKQVNHIKKGSYENVVLGESMGGLIGRIGLKEFENENYDHQTKLFISFDSPHRGANVPIGLQHLSNDLLSYAPVALFDLLFDESDLDALKAVRDAPAAKQMSVIWYENDGPDPAFIALQTKLQTLGHPEKCKKVAVINGNNEGTQQNPVNNFNQGDEILSAQAIYVLVNADLSVHTQKTSGTTKVSHIVILSFIPEIPNYISYRWITQNNQAPYDIAPGGWQAQHKDFANAISFAATTNGRDQYCFVPAVSSLDLRTDYSGYNNYDHYFYYNETSTDLNRHATSLISNNMTPFDDIFSINSNTEHVQITSASFDMIDEELYKYITRIQNRTIYGVKSFYASYQIRIGSNVSRSSTRKGPVTLANNAIVTLHAPNIDISDGFNSGSGQLEFNPETLTNCSNSYPRSPSPIISGPASICYSIGGGGKAGRIIFTPKGEYSITNLTSYDATLRQITWTLSPDPRTGTGSVTQFSNKFTFPEIARVGNYTLNCRIQTTDIVAASITINISGQCPIKPPKGKNARMELDTLASTSFSSPSLNISPNPAMEKVTLNFNLGESKKAKIVISNIIGNIHETVYEIESVFMKSFSETIDVNHLPSGFYNLTLVTDSKSVTKKLIIVR